MPAFSENGINVKRVSVLHVTNDLAALGDIYAGLGFVSVSMETDESCSGWLSPDGSGVIISASGQIAREFGADIAADLTGQSIPYIYI